MLILTEKRSVAQDFATALKADKKNGFYQTNSLIITYCVGHLFELVEPDFYNIKYKKWKISDLPILPEVFFYKKNETTIKQTNIVLSLLKNNMHEKIIIATDADREGELIARIALDQAGIKDISNCYRFWVSEALTTDVILKGIENAQLLSNYKSLAEQGYARQQTDWLIGINFTRFISIGNPSVFSVGTVQTAVLSAIAKRNHDVKKFKATSYNEVIAEIKDNNNVKIKALLVNTQTKKTSFTLNDPYLKKAIIDCNNKKIQKSKSTIIKKTVRPEKLLNLNALQKIAYRQHEYSPEKTLQIAQKLYEVHKCLSYPRTSSRVLGEDNVNLCMTIFNNLKSTYSKISGFCNQNLIVKENKNIFDNSKLEAHHALIPLTLLSDDSTIEEKNIFNIVVKQFFNVCMDDYIYNEKKILFFIDMYTFKTSIKETIQPGFRIIEEEKKEEEKENEIQEVMSFNENNCIITNIASVTKKTNPPRHFNIDTLLTFMEKPIDTETNDLKLSGLGTSATRAEIIKKLFSVGYIEENKKNIIATEKGLFLLKELAKDSNLAKLANVSQRTRWEQELIKNPMVFLETIKTYVLESIRPEIKETYIKKSPGFCPLCKSPIIESDKNYYCSAYKIHNCKFVIWKNIFGTSLNFNDVQILLNNKETAIKNCKTKENKKYKAQLKLNTEGRVVLNFSKKKR